MQPTFNPGQEPNPGNPFGTVVAQAAMTDQYLKQAYNAAGGNFYSIALFSLINSVINIFNGSIYFPIGLGITQIIDAISFAVRQEAPEVGTVVFVIGVVLDLIIFGIVAAFGYFTKKQVAWLLPLGWVLYLLDGLLILLFQDWIGGAFHAYFLFRLWQAWQVIRNISKSNIQVSAIESPK